MCDKEIEILLVEDNPQDIELALRALKKSNLANNIFIIKDGAEALDFIFGTGKYCQREIRQTPRVVFLDLKLPKVSGLEILKRVKSDERTKHIPFVVLTSSQEDKDRIESYRLGVNSYIVKPLDFNKFMECVVDLGLYWLLINKIHK